MASATPAYCDGEGCTEKQDPAKEAEYQKMLAEAAKIDDSCVFAAMKTRIFEAGKEVALMGGKDGKKIGDVGFAMMNHMKQMVGTDKTPKSKNMMIKVSIGKCKALSKTNDYKSLTSSMLKVMKRTASYFAGMSSGIGVAGVLMVKYGDEKIGYFATSGCPAPKNDVLIARLTLLKVGLIEGADGIFTLPAPKSTEEDETANLPKIKGGYKKGTDVPLIPQPSSGEFKVKVANLKEQIAAGDQASIVKVLNFAVFIFGMRHPNELRGLLDNLEAVFRARAGAEDGAIDPEEGVADEEKFEALKKKIVGGDKAAWYEIAVAAISLISIFHVDQLPVLMAISEALKDSNAPRPAASEFSKRQLALEGAQTELQVVQTVAIWAVSCFALFHPDIVVKMGLVSA